MARGSDIVWVRSPAGAPRVDELCRATHHAGCSRAPPLQVVPHRRWSRSRWPRMLRPLRRTCVPSPSLKERTKRVGVAQHAHTTTVSEKLCRSTVSPVLVQHARAHTRAFPSMAPSSVCHCQPPDTRALQGGMATHRGALVSQQRHQLLARRPSAPHVAGACAPRTHPHPPALVSAELARVRNRGGLGVVLERSLSREKGTLGRPSLKWAGTDVNPYA